LPPKLYLLLYKILAQMSYSDSLLTAMRRTGDQPADELIESVFGDGEKKLAFKNWLDAVQSNAALEQAGQEFSSNNIVQNSNRLPSWANRKVMNAGNAFFARHAAQILNLMGLLSLPYCYAAADGAMVLHLSERMNQDTGKRLLETATFIWDVMSPDAFSKNGKGFSSILTVRLMHAAGRYYTLKSGHWNESWGHPINQEDMAGTNLSFSLIVIRGLRKLGLQVSYAEQQAFMHLWNVIGFLLGVTGELLPTDGKQATDLEEAIRLRHFKPSAHGQELTLSLTKYITAIDSGTTSGGVSAANVLQLMRYLLGNEIADMLAIKSGNLSAVELRLLKLAISAGDLGGGIGGDVSRLYNEAFVKFRKISNQALTQLS